MSGNSILKDSCLITERYGTDLEKLNQDDRVGLMRTSDVSVWVLSLLSFIINGNFTFLLILCQTSLVNLVNLVLHIDIVYPQSLEAQEILC